MTRAENACGQSSLASRPLLHGFDCKQLSNADATTVGDPCTSPRRTMNGAFLPFRSQLQATALQACKVACGHVRVAGTSEWPPSGARTSPVFLWRLPAGLFAAAAA